MNIEDLAKLLQGSNINVKGDLVMEKHVEHEIDNVEPGGIGIQIVNGAPASTSQGDAPMNQGEAAMSQSASSPDKEKSARRGPQLEFLFIEGDPSWSEQGKLRHSTVENQAVARQERNRLMGYLSHHCLANRMLNATLGDTLNKTIICFVMQWRDMGLTAEHPSGRAIFRFLTEECGMKTEVSLSSYGNKMSQWLKEKQYDVVTLREVKSCFSHC